MTSEIKPEDVKLPEPDDDRQRFEAWAAQFRYDLTRCDASYVNQPYANEHTDWSWLAWQASADQVRAAVLEAKAQERERCAKLCDAETQIAHGAFGVGWVEGARTCAAAIRAGHSITETPLGEG